MIGRNVEIAANTSLTAYPGGHIEVGDDVFIGGGDLIAARDWISIGRESLIAELVAIRDHDHDPAFPPRSGCMLASPVHIGARVWIGAKASVVRGASIGDDAVIGAHALVNRPVPAVCLAVGVPARVIREHIR